MLLRWRLRLPALELPFVLLCLNSDSSVLTTGWRWGTRQMSCVADGSFVTLHLLGIVQSMVHTGKWVIYSPLLMPQTLLLISVPTFT
jgi:hypothetical protein